MYLYAAVDHRKVYLGRIPKGYNGTRKTIDYIVSLIHEGAKDYCVRQQAIEVLFQNDVKPKDYWGEIKTLFDQPSWGSMLDHGAEVFLLAPHLAFAPGLAILVTVLALNFVGDGLRDWFDPRTVDQIRDAAA